MKQHITKEQWGEIDRDKQKILQKSLSTEYDPDLIPNIGQMIEFLGDDLCAIEQLCRKFDDDIKGFEVVAGDCSYEKQELCDALWEAIKYKLTK